MHTSMHIVGPQSKAMQPRQRLQHTPHQATLQLPRSTAVSGQHAARNMGQRPLLPPCSAHRQHASGAAASHSAARVGLKRHVRGWGSYQQGTCTRRCGVVAASDDDASSALSVYSSSGAHVSRSHAEIACELLKTERCQQGRKTWVGAEVRWGSRLWWTPFVRRVQQQ